MKISLKYEVSEYKKFGLLFSIFFIIFFSFILPFLFNVILFKNFDHFLIKLLYISDLTYINKILLWPFFISFLIAIISKFTPKIIYPLYVVWMNFASILGWVNSRVILFLIYYFIFVPTGFVTKIIFMEDRFSFKRNENEISYKKSTEIYKSVSMQSEDFNIRINKPY